MEPINNDSAYNGLKFLIMEYRETIKTSFFEIRSSSEVGDMMMENLINRCTNTIAEIDNRSVNTELDSIAQAVQSILTQMQALMSTVGQEKVEVEYIT
ncbi:MAG: hypothetical protein JRN19_01170 [Nitrososphaerota archaeon]|jgi:hypothetical protein|nr:hypothetical protein [Nitrososphaerota archaeon]MDG7048385.1 hypothetical protein [Nitrososphaerota archaeon]MDG7048525.1 hypothetical protein [Nitrososphaerota archaeon]MDG7051056.1 hypothetical protein [Nitrososphaerota archaeon]